MSVNSYRPHVFVLPEDGANRQIANGFLLNISSSRLRRIQVLEEAGGWRQVIEQFAAHHIPEMRKYAHRVMVLLLDFDRHEDRRTDIMNTIPELASRVFVLGAFSEPEELRQAGLGSYEQIGAALADDCRDRTDRAWGHGLLRHNTEELIRMGERIREILFE